MLKRLDDYRVRTFKRDESMRLGELRRPKYSRIYLAIQKGRWVNELAKFNGKQLYHKEDDFVELQAALMIQDGELVLSASRDDTEELGESERGILEANLLVSYLRSVGIDAIDLTQENIVEGRYRSKPIPGTARQRIKADVKFVDIWALPNKLFWAVSRNLKRPPFYGIFSMSRGNINKAL